MVEQPEYAVIIAARKQVDIIFLKEAYPVAYHVDSRYSIRFGILASCKASDEEPSISGALNI